MSTLRYLNKNFNRLADLKCFIGAIPQGEHSVHTLDIHRQELTRLWEDNAEDTKISIEDVNSIYTPYF